MITLPESVPAINFAEYKARIPVAGMVDTFQKEYEALKVPYPADTVSQQIADVESAAVSNFLTFFLFFFCFSQVATFFISLVKSLNH